MRRLVLLLVAVLTLAACGGGGGGGSSDQDQIKSAYEQFFSGKSTVDERVAVLQNGERFKPLVTSFASNPLAKQASAKVSTVTLHGPNKATVEYVVKFGNTALPKQTGTAVRENGKWKVGYLGLCKLVALQGSTPAACKP
ncbi:MAG TPA: hypothetical protein VE220_00310 [Gaiellaceae bacterium]|nr:hypothetical protein [Gaiellaceae bacterium]